MKLNVKTLGELRIKIRKIESFIFTFLAKRTISGGLKFKANGYTKLSKKTSLGVNCHFNGLIINGKGKVTIGDNFHSGINCRFITVNHNFNGSLLPYDQSEVIKDITIGDNVWLGRDVTILGGVTVGEGAIIQACSVVSSNIAPLSIAGGHPARVFSQRDEKHYFQLKGDKKFL